MKRIIKLTISSFYFVWMQIQHFIKRMLKIDIQPICVALYYHSIFDNEKKTFEKQMNLISQKCEVISSDYSGNLEPNKLYSIITFDDGFENLVYNAVPILKKYNLPFTIFFISSYFGKKPEWEFDGYHPDQNERIMTIEQMNDLPQKLITIGSHTVSHNKLTSCVEEDLVHELKESKNQLENFSKRKVEILAFPNGEYNNFIVQKSLETGYKRVFTIEPKLALKTKDEKVTGRISVNGNDWYPEFWLKIHGAYSWLNAFQSKQKYNNKMTTNNITYKTQKLTSKEWNNILGLFDDASVYQTNAFTKYSIGGENSEHFIVQQNNNIIAAAQVRLKTIPIFNRGVAYLRWAPMWQIKNSNNSLANFQIALELLYKEYVLKRKLVLRIISNHFLEEENNYTEIFNNLGFTKFQPEDKTIIIDLSQDVETLRKNFRKKWRYSLKQAEKKELTIVKGNNRELFDEFVKIYKEMHSRKNFKETVSVDTFKKINDDLENENKLQILICKYENTPLSAMVSTAMGNRGIYLLGGSTSEGLKMSSSYLLQWETMMWLKSIGIKWYDLGGVDAEANPGVYTFKTGMGGKEVTFIGGFEAGKNLLSKKIVQLGELILKVKSKK